MTDAAIPVDSRDTQPKSRIHILHTEHAAMPTSDGPRARKQLQSRLLHNFTTINAANAERRAKLQA